MGLVGNARYMEMADFALGWIGIDIAGDDGTKLGQSPEELDTIFVWARDDPPPLYTHCERCGQRVYAPGMAHGPGGWSPIRSVRRIFVRREPKAVCRCPMAEQRVLASRPPRRRPRIPFPARLPRPSAPSTLSVSSLPEDCRLRQAIEGKSPAIQLADGSAKVVNGAWQVGKFSWGVGRTAVRVLFAVPRVVRALTPARRQPKRTAQRPPPRTAKARPQLPRP